MTEQKPGFLAQVKSYPATFWVANTMEIFERMSWYGWFTVMAVYVTGTVETGGLGFTTETRGNLQAIVPFFLYLMPVLTGALADRYGFKKMFVIAYLIMILAYYLLGQFHTLPTFFLAFMFVAVGAAIFKPVVVGTVATVTDDSNSATGFGIFYMMVNVGGFAGPIVAGQVRGWGWEWVFVACSAWAFINLLIVLIFYKEPTTEASSGNKRTLRKVLDNTVEVLGNLRFFITVFGVLLALMAASIIAGKDYAWFSWWRCAGVIVAWVTLNFIWDLIMPAGSGRPQRTGAAGRFPLFKRMHCSNWRFALFLLIMSGFWTSFNQIFYTMPEYIRDFVDTRPVINVFEAVFGESDPNDPKVGVAKSVATINDEEYAVIAREVTILHNALTSESTPHRDLFRAIPQERFDEIIALAPPDLQEYFAEMPEGHGTQDEAGDGSADAFASKLEALTETQFEQILAAAEQLLGSQWRVTLTAEALDQTSLALLSSKVRLTPAELETYVGADAERVKGVVESVFNKLKAVYTPDEDLDTELLASTSEGLPELERLSLDTLQVMVATCDTAQLAVVTNQVVIKGRQVNPEFIVNINALGIVLFQVLVSFSMARFHRFTTMIVGMLIAAVGIGFSTIAGGEGMVGVGSLIWVVAGGIFIFSFGEMMASPTSQEYVGRIAPGNRKALYMGYFFVAVALGNLFGGILSGQLYGKFARDMGRPDLMWICFGGIMLFTALVFMLYNKFALPKEAADTLTNN